MPSCRSLLSVALAGILAAACSDNTATLAPAAVIPTSPSALASQNLLCSVSVPARAVSCSDASTGGSVSRDIIVGGQNLYVKLTSSNVTTVGTTFSFDATIQNLIPQAMGTTDGATADGTGIRVFFQQLPVATAGSGTITVSNPTGTNGTFTGSNQTFYTYPGTAFGADGILSTNEVSTAQNWQFNVPATVTAFQFSVYVSANVAAPSGYVALSAPSPAMLASGTQVLTATVKSAVGNVIAGQAVTFGTNDASIATVANDGTVTAVGPGTATITATSGGRTGTIAVNVCPNLALGGVYTYSGTSASSFCLGGSTLGQEYVVIPYNGDDANSVALSVTSTGISAVSGTPTPSVAPSASRSIASLGLFQPKQDFSIEKRIRDSERELGARLGPAVRTSRSAPAGGIPGPSYSITPGVPTVGTVMTLNVGLNGCADDDDRAVTVKAVGTRIILMEDNTNPAGGFTATDYANIAATFDTLVYPAVANNFGAPNDIDNNGRVVALYTARVNDMTPPGSSSYTGGFFYSRDLYSVAQCAGSNVGEMFYMLAPDPTGVRGNVRTTSFVLGKTNATLAHEFQHLINASRRNASNFKNEDGWLNEGMSHIAEELTYYASSGRSTGGNASYSTITATGAQQTAFFDYAESNFGRLRYHLLNMGANTGTGTEADSPTQNDDDLGTRGAAWSFLRYAADRKGGSQSALWNALAFVADTGRTNVSNRLGVDMDTWLKDWVVSLYADDASLGSTSSYLSPSWDFRSIYSNLNYGTTVQYPLTVRDPSSNVAENMTLVQNGASYLRMGVAASGFATVNVAKSGGGALPGTVSVMVLRRK